MTYKPNLESESTAILDAKKWGVGVITTMLGFGMILSELQRIKESFPNILTLGYLTLFATTGILVFLWLWASKKELKLCFIWLDPERYDPPSSFKETMMIVGLGVVLSILFFASRDPLFYGIIFTIYSMIVTYTNYYTKNEIYRAIIGSRNRLKKELKNNKKKKLTKQFIKGVNVLEYYFYKRPQTTRHILIVGGCIIGLTLGVIWKITNNEFFGAGTYLCFFLLIAISEIIIASWRLNRDNNLRPIKAEINELCRKD